MPLIRILPSAFVFQLQIDALRAAARPVAAKAKQLVPLGDTKNLRRSITVRRLNKRQQRAAISTLLRGAGFGRDYHLRVTGGNSKAAWSRHRAAINKELAESNRRGENQVVVGFRRIVNGEHVSRRAHLIEFGTVHSAAQPFLRPAAQAAADDALRAAQAYLAAKVPDLARELAGEFDRISATNKRRLARL